MITMGLTSVAEVYRVIKQFHFNADQAIGHNPFEDLTFSDTDLIELSRLEDYQVKLVRMSNGYYPTDADIWFRTWTTTPAACRQLLMLQVFPNIQSDGAEIQVRLYDGTEDLYWDGAAWSSAGAGDWNTEAEINEHIATFPIIPDRTFAVTVNLRSVAGDSVSAGEVTPYVSEIRVAMEVHIDFMEDLVLRSLMPLLDTEITAVANFAAMPAPTADTTELDFGQLRINTPYQISGIERVYDLVDDIELLYNLYDSYDSGTGIITLNTVLPAGHTPLIVFRYSPVTSFITHQDYIELSAVPALVIQKMEIPVSESYSNAAVEGVVDKGTGNAIVIDDPVRLSIEFRIHVITASLVDEMRLQSKILEFFKEHTFVTSTGLDESYRMFLDTKVSDMSTPNRVDERAFWAKFVIYDVRLPVISRDEHAVTSVNVTITSPQPPHNDPIKGGTSTTPYVHLPDAAIIWTRTIQVTE